MTQASKHSLPLDSAGRAMVGKEKVPVVFLGTTLAQARALVETKSKVYESINYLYVTDQRGRLQGVVSIKELLGQGGTKGRVEDIMQKNLVTVRPHTHQERAGLLALQHSVKSLPVVDKDGVLQGVIPFDAILKILDQEAVENFLRLGGISYTGPYDNLLRLSLFQSIKHRLPWLLVGLGGGFLIAFIVRGFEETLSQNLILAAFIPLIVYMADAVGTQMEAFIIRDLALNPNFNFAKYFLRQGFVVGFIALGMSILLYGVSFFLYGAPFMSIVLGIALFCAVLSSLFSGLLVPYAFEKLKLDPANAAGPVATIIQDALSVFVFFLIASLMLT